MRKTPFVNGEFYHIFNRGTDKRTVFSNDYDFKRFVQSMEEFNSVEPIESIYVNSFREPKLKRRKSKLVNIVCYCLNINHFHMILEQIADGGISEFMKRLGGGYTKYFNHRHKRSGVLFQGKFKSRHIDSNEYLLHASAYVNLNNLAHKIRGEKFKSSWAEYIGIGGGNKNICKKPIILSQFRNAKEYKNFADNSLKDILARKDLFREMERMLLE